MVYESLYHHGIKGMRWGVRRSRQQLGYDDAGNGRKKRKSLFSKRSKDNAETPDDDNAPKKKSVKDMSDDELLTAIYRAKLEDQYKALRPEEISAGQKFANTLKDKVLGPAMVSAGEAFLRKSLTQLGDKLLEGNKPVDKTAALRKEYETLDLKKKINDLKNPKKEETLEDAVKRMTTEKRYRDLKKDLYGDDKSTTSEKDKKTEKTEKVKPEPKEDKKVYTGTVEWPDYRKETVKEQKVGKDYVDAEWRDVTYDEVSTGKKFIAGLLGDGTERDD